MQDTSQPTFATVMLLFLAACGGDQSAQPIPIDDFCDELYQAGCDVGQRCRTAPADRTECLTFVEDMWDACPMAQLAVGLHETQYDSDAARTLIIDTRQAPCGGNPVPDWVEEVPVFSPMLGQGDSCHSKVSCRVGLECRDLSVEQPQGICESP